MCTSTHPLNSQSSRRPGDHLGLPEILDPASTAPAVAASIPVAAHEVRVGAQSGGAAFALWDCALAGELRRKRGKRGDGGEGGYELSFQGYI